MVERNEDRLDRLEANLSKINADAKYILDLLEKRNARLEEMNNRFDYGNRFATDTSIRQGNWYRGPDPGGGVNIVRQRNQNLEPNPIGGARTGNHLDYSAVPRMEELDFPRFDGREVSDWLFKVDRFFEMDVTPEFHKIRLVSNHLDGEAATWHQSLLLSEFGRRINRDWDHYKVEVRKRFADPMAELKYLQETDGIEAYHAKFERIIFRWDLSEEYLVNAYIAGLKLDMQMHVKMLKPKSISKCFFLGRLYEQFPPKKNVSWVNTKTNSNGGHCCNQKGALPFRKEAETRQIQAGENSEWLEIENAEQKSTQVEEEPALEEELIKINQETEAKKSIQEEEMIETVNSIQDDDSNSMESLLISDSSKSQVKISPLEPRLHCYSESMVVYEQQSSFAWEMLLESDLNTMARSLTMARFLGTRLQIITEKEYAHHLIDEMTVKKQMLHEKEIRSLFSKCWKFKFKNLLCFLIDQVIQCGVLPHLVEFLKNEDFPKLLFEAITAPFAVILSCLGLNQAATNFYSFDQGRMAAYSLFEMITRSSSVANQGAVLASVQGNIEFRNVYFINADYIAVMEEGQLDEMGTHDELINLGGLYAELLKCEEETKFPRRCGALKPLSVQRDSEPSVIALLAVGIKQRMQQPKRKRNSLFPKNWKFKFKNRDLGREKQGWKQSVGAKCELNFQLE